MKPHDRRNDKRATEHAVRAQLRQGLGWLRGFPVASRGASVMWLCRPSGSASPEQLAREIDREALRAAAQAKNAIRKRFPRALPRVVGDVEAWNAAIEARFDLLKACVHDGALLPTLAAVLATSGLTCTPEEPVPMIPTRLPWKSGSPS